MTKLMQGLFVSVWLLATVNTAFAGTDPHHLSPNAPRTIAVTDGEAPPVVRAGLLQATLIMLPTEEKVATVFGGNTVDWVFDGGHVASRFISIKPKIAGSTTDVHIVSDHGNEYTLQLREVSADEDPHFDSKILLSPADKTAKERLTELPVFVPASDLERLKQELAAQKAQADAERKQEDAKAEQYRSLYPASIRSTTATRCRLTETIYRRKIRPFGKTPKSLGKMHLPDDLAAELRSWKLECPDPSPDAFIFANADGGYLDVGNYRNRVLKPLAERLDIPKLTFQVLRRTMATRAQSMGSVKDIQAHLRHSRADTTANEYMQEIPESVQQMVGNVFAMLTLSEGVQIVN